MTGTKLKTKAEPRPENRRLGYARVSTAGDQMALEVEGVVDGGVSAEKPRAPVDGLFPFCVIANGQFPFVIWKTTRVMSDMGASSGARRRGSPRPCRDRNRHQNSHAQSRSVRTPDGRSQGDQRRSVGSPGGKSRGGTRSSSIGQIRRKLRQAIPKAEDPVSSSASGGLVAP